MQETQPTRRPSARYAEIDVERYRHELTAILSAISAAPVYNEKVLRRVLRRHPRDGTGFFSKSQLVDAYRRFCAAGELAFEPETLNRLQMKPVRTQSGVAPVAVLTKPAGCPGRCIFCPNDPDMPKSYLSREPGAQRALRHQFDPFEQTHSRLTALNNVGHPIQKVELLILGGTWSAYPHSYQEWFIHRCLDALNGHESATLAEAQDRNEQAPSRCVGLTVETRPDWITPEEVVRLRGLGVTRVQIGIQSLDDRILALNNRGHDMEAARRACRLLRAAGFKLLLHWMPNLYGATPESDREDFARLWSDPDMQPDELKIYPCALVEDTELYDLWRQGQFVPYDEQTLIDLLADCKAQAPVYCRLSRVVRDIPSDYVVEGNRLSNLREAVQARLAASGRSCRCIRCREVGDHVVEVDALQFRVTLHPHRRRRGALHCCGDAGGPTGRLPASAVARRPGRAAPGARRQRHHPRGTRLRSGAAHRRSERRRGATSGFGWTPACGGRGHCPPRRLGRLGGHRRARHAGLLSTARFSVG